LSTNQQETEVNQDPQDPGHRPANDGRRWISFDDSNGDTWLFDSTFMQSGFDCIYGNGCKSIDTKPDPTHTLGCCIHGAHFADKKDRKTTRTYIDRLSSDQWQFKGVAEDLGDGRATKGSVVKNDDGDWVTPTHDGACIFLNRDGFEGGAGCALHIGALQSGERPLDWKPDVCWQVPIRLDVHTDDEGHDTVFIKPWQQRDWGSGGEDFNWWCIDSTEAYDHPNPLYVSNREELIELVGEEIYGKLAAELDRQRRGVSVTLTTK
jgi:hypothetical protein